MKRIAFAIALSACAAIVYSQTWQKVFDTQKTDYNQYIAPAGDGYLALQSNGCNIPQVACFESTFLYVDKSGNFLHCDTLYTTNPPDSLFGAGEIIFDEKDSSIVFTSVRNVNPTINDSDVILAKYDKNLQRIWLRQFSDYFANRPNELIKCRDGGYAIIAEGELTPISPQKAGSYLIRTDSIGQKLWIKQFFDPKWYTKPISVYEEASGNLIVSVKSQFKNDSIDDVSSITQIHRVNGAGPSVDSVFLFAYEAGRSYWDRWQFAAPMGNGRIMASIERDSWENFYLAIVDSANLQEVTRWDPNLVVGNTELYGMLACKNGDVIVHGKALSATETGFRDYLIRYAPDGQEVWRHYYRYCFAPEVDTFNNQIKSFGWYRLIEDDEGYLVASGNWLTKQPNSPFSKSDVVVARIDPNGCFTPGCTKHDTLIWVCDLATMVDEAVADEKKDFISVSPNPTDGPFHLYFSAPLQRESLLELFDISGKKAFSKAITKNAIAADFDFSDLADGLYIWQLSTDETRLANGKVIKFDR